MLDVDGSRLASSIEELRQALFFDASHMPNQYFRLRPYLSV